jgi:hypothetical protein
VGDYVSAFCLGGHHRPFRRCKQERCLNLCMCIMIILVVVLFVLRRAPLRMHLYFCFGLLVLSLTVCSAFKQFLCPPSSSWWSVYCYLMCAPLLSKPSFCIRGHVLFFWLLPCWVSAIDSHFMSLILSEAQSHKYSERYTEILSDEGYV